MDPDEETNFRHTILLKCSAHKEDRVDSQKVANAEEKHQDLGPQVPFLVLLTKDVLKGQDLVRLY